MDSTEILIITHIPYVAMAVLGIIGLRITRKKLEVINKNLGGN